MVGDTCPPHLLNFPLYVSTCFVHGGVALVPNTEKPRRFLYLASENCILDNPQG
jgi:hypothetical protein